MEWLCFLLSSWDIALIVLVGLFISRCIIDRITNKGPMLWPLFGIFPSFMLHLNDVYGWITYALIKSGGTFPFRGFCMGKLYGVITAHPSNIEYMLKTKFENFPKGKYYRERFFDLLGDGIFNVDYDLWKEQRRIATAEMHSRRFVEHSFQSMQTLVHKKLLKVTKKFVDSGEAFDLQELLLRFTFDGICAAAFGVEPGCVASDLPEVPFAKAFEEATELTLARFMIPPFVWKPMKQLGVGYEKRLKSSIDIVHKFAEKTVKERRNEMSKLGGLKDRSDLLSRIMDNDYQDRNQETVNHFPDVFLRDFCISFILAGRDTTSVALAWFFWLIHKNPNVETKILDEIYEILGPRRCQNDVAFTFIDLKKMVYLHAALSESLRLYPSVPIEIKEVQEDDNLPDGTCVKKGARVFYCIFSMGRMKSIWGENCLEFKPERWIKDEQLVIENQFKYAVFNAGPRLCVGKKFAYMQMKMVAASILLRYSIDVVETHPVVPKVNTTLYMKNGLLVTLKHRTMGSDSGM